ncbi:MAG TPA: CHAD domain-containing protein [Candidatus Binataceae bacterium]|nr:CHAD domain-containing protein [Candidatus Binataceae bacterium]
MEESRPAETPPPVRFKADLAIVDAVRQALADGAAWLWYYDAAARRGDSEGVHQFRVTVRRLRAAIELAAPILHGARLRYYRTELPVMGHCAGAVRDCDVMSELLHEHANALDPVNARALMPAFQALADHRMATMRAMIALLNSPRYRRLTTRLAPPLTRKVPPETTTRIIAPTLLKPLIGSARRAGARLRRDSTPPVFHRLRVRLKRVRYAFELIDEIGGKRTAKTVKRLRRLQDELGEHQDLVNTSIWLRDFAKYPALPPETLVATGALIQFIGERRVEVAGRAFKRWRKFARGAFLAAAQDEIAHAARQAVIAPAVALA